MRGGQRIRDLNPVIERLVDRHVAAGQGSRTALIYDSPVTDTVKKYTYKALRDEVAKFAGVLASQGVVKGDRVLIYMPMIPEAAIAMLACGRIGAVHSVVFGGFAANELAVRIDDCTPKAIIAALSPQRATDGTWTVTPCPAASAAMRRSARARRGPPVSHS